VARMYINQGLIETDVYDPAAPEHLEKARSIYEKVVVADDLALLQADLAIADARIRQGQYVEAESILRRIVPILGARLSSQARGYIPAVFDLGLALDRQGKRDDATPFFDRAAALATTRDDYGSAIVLGMIARAFLDRGRLTPGITCVDLGGDSRHVRTSFYN